MSVIIAMDFETTGLLVGKCDVIQIGATRLSDVGLPTRMKFERKLHITHPETVQPGVLGRFNYYDEAEWKEKAVAPALGWQQFADWVFECSGGGVVKPRFLGHNIGKFDYPMMEAWSKHYGVNIHHDYHLLDTVSIFTSFKRRALINRWGCKMEDICAVMEFTNPRPHDALADCASDALGYALMEMYLDILIDVGRGHTHTQYLDEAYARLGMAAARKPDHKPLVRLAA